MKLSSSPVIPTLLLLLLASAAAAQSDDPVADETPTDVPTIVLATSGPDTLRTNLEIAAALMSEAIGSLEAELPLPPAVMVLVPGSTEPAAELLTDVTFNHLQAAGYDVYIDQAPAETEPPVYEFRYRVQDLQLAYPTSGRRLLFWKSWVGRQMDLALQITVVSGDGQMLLSRRLVHGFRDRVPVKNMEAVESTAYPFTFAEEQSSGSSRRLEQIVVLGALAGLVAVYFANTE